MIDTYFAYLSFIQILNSRTQALWLHRSYRKLSISLLGNVIDCFIIILVVDLDKVVLKHGLGEHVVPNSLDQTQFRVHRR